MTNNEERRINELTRALEDVLDCFNDVGETWGVMDQDGDYILVHSDVQTIIERALNVLYNEEDLGTPEDTDRYYHEV